MPEKHFCTNDKYYMHLALELAERGRGRTSPNPMVGAVVVKDGEIVGRGYHARAGEPHAEVHALREAGEKARGATIYVSLEPCNHQGCTPPCTEAVINAGISRVFAAMVDPNPLVAGQGLQRLGDAGITVEFGLLEEKARQQNEVFIKFISTAQPFVHLKWAMTLDGKIAAARGREKRITGPEASLYTHLLRDRYDAVMVGIGTVLADDPLLTVRIAGKSPAEDEQALAKRIKQPARIIVDSKLRLPVDARLLQDLSAPVIVAAAGETAGQCPPAIEGAEVIIIPGGPQVDLPGLLRELGSRGITSVLLEGGAALNASFLEAGLVDKVTCFVAPKIIGGAEAMGPVGGEGRSLDMPLKLEQIQTWRLGEDIVIEGYPAGRGRIRWS